MRIPYTTCLAIMLCGLSLVSPAFAQSVLPSNLKVAPVYREFVESIGTQSATFRGQLDRIAAEPGLVVRVEVVPHIIGARAMTRIVRQGGNLTAHIQVTRFDDIVELIAHELEHVIEQIEGVDLARRADAGQTGIYAVERDGTMFETARAGSVGVSVAQEVRDAGRRRS